MGIVAIIEKQQVIHICILGMGDVLLPYVFLLLLVVRGDPS